MTTAARPTFDTARGGKGKWEGDLSAQSKQYSSRDLPAHTKLKYRNEGQGTTEELRGKDFKRDLDERERTAREKRERGSGGGGERRDYKRQRTEAITAATLDADDPQDLEEEEEASGNESDDEDALLMAELAKIKKERAAEAAKREAERKAEEERIRMENILKGNPLLNQAQQQSASAVTAAAYKVRRRWDDDVVFKNCARGANDEKKKPEFINDTLRSEFHKKFMDKYIK